MSLEPNISDLSTTPTIFWDRFLSVLKSRVSTDSFNRWFSNISLISQNESEIHLLVPNLIHQFFIESNYFCLIQSIIEEVYSKKLTINFDTPDNNHPEIKENHSDKENKRQKDRAPFQDSIFGMNPDYKFETFIVGSNNQFAHAVAQAVAHSPAKRYNPLFIYGNSGLGKTHLLQSIGYYVKDAKKNAKIFYIRSEQFTNEFISAIQNNSLVGFRKQYRQADILLIDDIQFFAGKGRSQEELFHTFGALYDGHKQIVLSSDKPASEIANLEQRLVSRFEWGMTAEIEFPDFETRMAIIQKKVIRMGMNIDTWILNFLAENIQTDVRRLEGALMRIAAYSSLNREPITTKKIDQLLKDFLQDHLNKNITIEEIQKKVADHFGITMIDIMAKNRYIHTTYPRHIAMYLARKYTSLTLAEISSAFGMKDHGTVIYACKTIKKRLLVDRKTEDILNLLHL